MAEEGSFRTSISGFHKADVLSYIDTMQSRHDEELRGRDLEIGRLRQAVTAQETYVTELKEQTDRSLEEAESLRRENETLRAEMEKINRQEDDCRRLSEEAEILRMEKTELTARLEEMRRRLDSVASLEEELAGLRRQEQEWAARCEAEQQREEAGERERAFWQKEKAELVAGLHELADQLEETEKQRIALLESNRRYEALAGDVGSFVMELHTMGQRFLETAYQRSDACLNAVEGVVGSLSSRLGEARAQTDKARQELADQGTTAGLRLDELVQKLEESAAEAPNAEPTDE